MLTLVQNASIVLDQFMLISNTDVAAAFGLIWFFAFAQLGLLIWVANKELFWECAAKFLFVLGWVGIMVGAIVIVGIHVTGSFQFVWIGTSNEYFEMVGIIMVATIIANAIVLPIMRWAGKQVIV